MPAARAKALPLPYDDPAAVAEAELAKTPLPRRRAASVKKRVKSRRLELAATPRLREFDVDGFLALEDDGPGTVS